MSESGGARDRVYHLELRQFPHNVCRFNVPEAELREQVLVPWAQEKWIEFGERKWSPHQATLTVLRGPRIPFGQLTMGRGWRTAQRSSEEVTEELLAEVRVGPSGVQSAAPGESAAGAAAGSVSQVGGSLTQPPAGERRAEDLAADSLGLELLVRIGSEAAPLSRAWELAAERSPEATASATLALAEGAVESLLRAGLVALVRAAPGSEEATAIVGEEAAGLVRAASSWAGLAPGLMLRRV